MPQAPLIRRGPLRGLLALVLVALSAASWGAPQGDPIADFRRYYERAEREGDLPSRVEAVLILSGLESPRVVDELLGVLEDDHPEVVDAALRVLSGFRTRPPVERMLEALGAGSSRRRVALLEALAAGGYSRLVEPLADALADKRWEIRHAALSALGASHDEAALPALEAAVADPEPAVRCAALEGLCAIDPPTLLRVVPGPLADPTSWQVRACAVGALSKIRERDSIELLIPRLRLEEGRLRQDVAQALTRLTGRSLGLDAELWERFWASVGERYVPPSEADLQRLAARREETRERYEGLVRFHGIQTPSRAIVFVIDVSASMAQAVVEPRLRAEDQPAQPDDEPLRRIDLVKHELLRAIDDLAPYVEFNVLAFSTDVDSWRRSPTTATKGNKRAAKRWVERLDAIAGASEARTIRTREALSPALASTLLDTDAGRTNTWAALQQALGVAGRGAFDRHYDAPLDTILFLSDGSPSHGELIAPDDILRAVARVNRLRRIVIHTIAIGEFNKDFMEDLAHQNGGQYVDLGR